MLTGHGVDQFKSFDISLLLRGMQKLKPHMVRKAAPISPKILKDMYTLLDFSNKLHVAAWVAYIIAFFQESQI